MVSSPRQAPVSQSSVIRKLGRPKVRSLGEAGDVIVIHREYISDLLSSATAGAFAIAGIPINPGNIAMFPWLSGMASNFESYVFRGLKFLFETSAPTSTPGTVLMAVDYDRNDPLPSDKSTLMSLRDATRSAAWERNHLECTKEDLHKRKTYFVAESNSGGLPAAGGQPPPVISGQDERLDDVGEFLIGSSNSTALASLGELYVEYEVELLTPQGSGTPPDYYFAEIEGADTSGNITAVNPFGSDVNFSNSVVGRYLYLGLGIVYVAGAGSSAFIFTEPGSYSYSFTFVNDNSMVSLTVSSDAVGGNSRYNTLNIIAGNFLSAANSGIVVVRNTTPSTYAGVSNSFVGSLGYLTCALGALNKGNYAARLRISRIPDYDSNQSQATGWVGLEMKPQGRMTRRARRSRRFAPEPMGVSRSLNVAGNGLEESESSEKSKREIAPTELVSPIATVPLRGICALPGVRQVGH